MQMLLGCTVSLAASCLIPGPSVTLSALMFSFDLTHPHPPFSRDFLMSYKVSHNLFLSFARWYSSKVLLL